MSLRHESLPRQGFLPHAVEALLRTWSYRAAGLGLGALALFFWIALLTWRTHTVGMLDTESGNAFGPIGSILSDLMIQGLGLASVVAILPLMFFAGELFQKERVSLLSARLVFWPTSIILIAGGFAALPTVAAWPLQHSFGGLVGDFLYTFTRQILDTVEPSLGGFIAGVLLLAAGFALLFRALNLMPRDLLLLLEFEPRISREVAERPKRKRFGGLFGRKPRHNASTPAPVVAPEVAYPHSSTRYPESMHVAVAPSPVIHAPIATHAAPVAVAPDLFDDADDLPQLLRRDAGERAGMTAPLLSTDSHSDEQAMAARFAPSNMQLEQQLTNMQDAAPVVAQHADPEPVPSSYAPVQLSSDAPKSTLAASLLGKKTRRTPATFRLPSTKLLARGKAARSGAEFTQNVLRGNASLLEDVLADFGVKGQIINVHPGPVVTRYELEPARGIKAARVIGLADDIARSMSAHSARVAVVPGKNAIGIELPNARRDSVMLRDLLEDDAFKGTDGPLPMAIGKAIDGTPIVTDLSRMPHLLVAGTTGSGKSVGINAMILSLLYRHTPDTCRFIMIDPKMLELSVYNGIPHLLTPVVTDPQKAVLALNWAVREMEERYKRMSELGVRNMSAYNARLAEAASQNKPTDRVVKTGFDPETGEPVYENRAIAHTPMSYIVVVIDEMADLMMTAGKDIEAAIQRLAQMARAAGIHLITATQRPSVDVITGTVKANLPTRISFKVTTATDSRTILGQQGAEQLLGAGDMLFSQGGGQLSRVHGPFVSEDEVEAVVAHLSAQGTPQHIEGITDEPVGPTGGGTSSGMASGDAKSELYDKAVAIVLRDGKASTSYVQRRLSIGYNRAADLIEQMEAAGIVSPAGPTGRRDILAERV